MANFSRIDIIFQNEKSDSTTHLFQSSQTRDKSFLTHFKVHSQINRQLGVFHHYSKTIHYIHIPKTISKQPNVNKHQIQLTGTFKSLCC